MKCPSYLVAGTYWTLSSFDERFDPPVGVLCAVRGYV